MHSLFSSIADKAHTALNATPLGRPQGSEGGSGQSTSGSGGIFESPAFKGIQHQFRSIQQQYSSSVTPVQKMITTQKGVALDYDNVGRDAHAHSKELYMWGQNDNDDLKDVTDRLAWMSFIEGSLATTLAKELDASRAPFKALRDAESGSSGRRNIRAMLENQIARIEHDQRSGMEQKLTELRRQLRKAEEDDKPLEKEIELLKRKAIKESERVKWDAVREFAEKLSLIAQAATAALPALPDVPSSKVQPYAGAPLTASIRVTLQQALDNWRIGDSTFILREPNAADLHRSDTRSFGETHAHELSRINTGDPDTKASIPVTPPAVQDHPPRVPSHNANAPPSNPLVSPVLSAAATPTDLSSKAASSPPEGTASPPLNPAVLNQAPASIPPKATSPVPVVSPDPTMPSVQIPTITPTVAETGVPMSAGPEGPGPASGSLKDIKHPSPINLKAPDSGLAQQASSTSGFAGGAAHLESAEEGKKRLAREERERLLRTGGNAPAPVTATKPTYESAEEEKKRLEREERERLLHGGNSSTGQHESAEEEKKRLEREERDRMLLTGGSINPNPDPQAKQTSQGDGELPPYQEF